MKGYMKVRRCVIEIDVKEYIKVKNFNPSKKMGQNFLINEQIIKNIIKSISFDDVTNIIEIGPGLGALTKHLVETNKNIICIELDKRLFYIENGKADEIKKIICDVIFELISRNESITNIFFYLANGQHNISIKGIEEECVSKIIKTNDKTEIANYILENSFSLNILNKRECFNL